MTSSLFRKQTVAQMFAAVQQLAGFPHYIHQGGHQLALICRGQRKIAALLYTIAVPVIECMRLSQTLQT